MSRLRVLFKEQFFNELKKDLEIKNVHLVPKIEKIVVNLGIGYAAKDDNLIQQIKNDIFAITGQMPIEIKAKKSISNFKVREGMICSLQVTLRRTMMYEFLDRFVYIALPQCKNFFGFNPKSIQGKTCSLGLNDCSIFPEMPYRERLLSIGINIVTTSDNAKTTRKLLDKFKIPFKD
jgi:large subunit ribosomal protein L5